MRKGRKSATDARGPRPEATWWVETMQRKRCRIVLQVATVIALRVCSGCSHPAEPSPVVEASAAPAKPAAPAEPVLAASTPPLIDSVASLPIEPLGSLQHQAQQVRLGRSDVIRLQHTLVRDGDLESLRGLSGLRELLLETSELTDEGLGVLAELGQLEHLRIRGSRVGDLGLEHLSRCRRLRFLNLPQGQFSDRGLAALSQLTELELLRFGSPHVTDAGLASLRALPRLRFLHLIGVPLTDAALSEVERMSRLESCYLDEILVSDQAVTRLLTARPQLHLHLDQKHHDRDPQRDHDARE